MESLFDDKYSGISSLRKYEPLIRFDVDGKPQPRKPLSETPALDEKVAPIAESAPKAKPLQSAPSSKPHEDLKRKLDAPPPGGEPKKKQQKQQSIMAFFKKG